MYLLYYNQQDNSVVIADSLKRERNWELLEQNNSLESIVHRAQNYSKIYKSAPIIKEVEDKVNPTRLGQIRRKNQPRRQLTEEHKRKIGFANSGEKHGGWGTKLSEWHKKRQSIGMSAHIKIYQNPMKGRKHKPETKQKISENNGNRGKGKWRWIYNVYTREESRLFNGCEMPEGWSYGSPGRRKY